MKKIFAILGLLIYTGSSAMAQAPGYDDLIILFADANYEKLIREATKYTEKESTKNDALPYLWLSKGLYGMSQVGDRDPLYKNAFKESIAALGKFRKKDKSGVLFAEHSDYVEKVKGAIIESVMNEVDAKAYRKATPLLLNYYKINPGDLGAKYLEAACKFRENDKSTANTIWKEGEKGLSTITSIEGWSENDKKLLKIGVLESAECLVNSKQLAKAQALLSKVSPWFANDEEFKAKAAEFQ